MKTFIMILILVLAGLYYFVPNDIKTEYLSKIWVESDIFLIEEEVVDTNIWPIVDLELDETRKTSFSSNISNWKIISDISWGTMSYVKCYDKSNFENFSWNMVIHRVLLWKNKDVEVNLTDKTESKNLSMFVYRTESLNDVFPPEIEYVYECKNDISNLWSKRIEMDWNTITYDVVVWVVWFSWSTTWEYDLEIIEK